MVWFFGRPNPISEPEFSSPAHLTCPYPIPDVHFQSHRFCFRRRIDDGQEFRLGSRFDMLKMAFAHQPGAENSESHRLAHGNNRVVSIT
jgi:hypothetical protein